MSSRRWSNATKIVVVSILVILTVVLLVTFRTMISPTIVVFLLAFILNYPVNWIQGRLGWARGASVAAVYILLIGSLLLTPALSLPRLLDLVSSLQATLATLVGYLQNQPQNTPIFVIGNYQFPNENLLQEAGNFLQNIITFINPVSIARGVTSGILTVLYVLVVTFWLLKDARKLQRSIMDQIPPDYQEDMRRLAHELSVIWHAFLRGQIVLAVVVGVITWIPLRIVGMPNAGGLALLAGFMEFLPTVGPGFSGTIGTIAALYQGSTWLPIGQLSFGLIVLAIYAVIAQTESVYLIPRLVGRRVRLHPAITFVGIINGALIFGLLGVLLATPVIASVRTILAYIYRKLSDLEPFEPLQSAQPGLRIRGLIAGRKIEAVVFDLDGTLTEISWLAPTTAAKNLHWLDRLISPKRRKVITRYLMITIEGLINMIISYFQRQKRHKDLSHWLPLFNVLRGYPAPDELTVQPGVAELLRNLSTRYRLLLISTRERPIVDEIVKNTGLDKDLLGNPLFDKMITRGDVRHLLPNNETLVAAAAHLELDANAILVVSDTEITLRSAHTLNMTTAGVLSGLGTERNLTDANIILETTTALDEWL